jgi:6-phosphofructokinase 1
MGKSYKICVLASGGDAPGMNACVEAIYRYGVENGMEMWAGINGYNGIINGVFTQMDIENATCISERSGCVFKCGRAANFLEHEGFKSAVNNIKKHKFDAVVILGGNGSTNGAGRLKNAGVNVIVIPATIDNDVDFTKHSLGFESACESATRAIDALRATMETSGRNFVVEIMGRHCNKLTERIALAVFPDIIDMEGQRHTTRQIAEVFNKNRAMGKNSNFMLMQERKGADYIQQSMDTIKFIADLINDAKDTSIRLASVGYLQRGAVPAYFDRFLGGLYGRAAVDCVLAEKFGIGLSMENYKVVYKNIELAPIP